MLKLYITVRMVGREQNSDQFVATGLFVGMVSNLSYLHVSFSLFFS